MFFNDIGSSSFMPEAAVNFLYSLAGAVQTPENLIVTEMSFDSIIIDNIFTIIFGIMATIMSFYVLKYKKMALDYKEKEHRLQVEGIIDEGRHSVLFLTRESMVNYLIGMYKNANKGDVIWGQCVGCSSYTQEVRSRILDAAGRGIRFKIIVNSFSSALADFRALYDPFQDAELVEAKDNKLRIQGLSNREVVLAFPGVDSYTSVLIRNPHFVEIVKNWFDNRFDKLIQESKEAEGS